VLSVPHGFSTRAGGVSTGPFASLNTSTAVGDDLAHVGENVRRLTAAIGSSPDRLATPHQVHGVEVLEALEASDRLGDADAVVTRVSGLVVGVRTADCLPILIEDPVGRQVAAVHAGWRGVLGEVVTAAIVKLASRGAVPARLRVAVGPAIQACCFEVDGDLPARFSAKFGAGVVQRVAGKDRPHLDLRLAVARSVERAGVPADQVHSFTECTRCDLRFFSHRRDAGLTGRHLALISCLFGTSL
jgi:YfiH family protein